MTDALISKLAMQEECRSGGCRAARASWDVGFVEFACGSRFQVVEGRIVVMRPCSEASTSRAFFLNLECGVDMRDLKAEAQKARAREQAERVIEAFLRGNQSTDAIAREMRIDEAEVCRILEGHGAWR